MSRNVLKRRITIFFAWYDMWVGAYWDRNKRILYVCPLPMLVVAINIGRSARSLLKKLKPIDDPIIHEALSWKEKGGEA